MTAFYLYGLLNTYIKYIILLDSRMFRLLCTLLVFPAIYACIESRYPVYVCTHMGTDYYSPCMSDIASFWIKFERDDDSKICPKKSVYYTAECIDNITSLTNIPHITSHVKIDYHRAWWAHRIRPMNHLPKMEGIYQSVNHSRAVKQDMLCIKPCYNCIIDHVGVRHRLH